MKKVLLLLCLPEVAWYWKWGWRFKNAEPSDLALQWTRIGGGAAVLLGILALILPWFF